jgi:hypothetical protein
MRRFWTHLAAFIGAFLGFYAGLITLVATGGLDSAAWAPLFMSAGAGFLAGAAVAIVGESATARIAAIGGVGGLLLGGVFTAFDPDLTITAIVLALYSQALASLPTSRWVEA